MSRDLGCGSMGVDWEERINYDRMRKERLAKAIKAVDESEADVLFLFRLETVRYITGLRTHDWPMSSWGMADVILPKGGDYILYSPDYFHAEARMPWLGDHLAGLASGVKSKSLELYEGALTWAKDAKERLEKMGMDPKVIGVDSWNPALYQVLPEVFPKSKFIDGQSIILKARATKTKDEIMCLKQAYAITAAGMQAGYEYIRPGVKECEVLAECFRAMYRYGSEWSQCANIVCSGPYTAPYRRFTSDRIIEYGDPVVIDIGGRFNGYWGDFTRTWICGKNAQPSKELIEFHDKAYKALRDAEKAIKPGSTTRDVAMAAGDAILIQSLGHGLGIAPAEPPMIGTYDAVYSKEHTTKLEPGMVFSVEPYAGKEGIGGIRLEDNFAVTETGVEVISKFPFEEKFF